MFAGAARAVNDLYYNIMNHHETETLIPSTCEIKRSVPMSYVVSERFEGLY